MNIKCLADDYAVVERNDMFYAYNKLYEGAEKGLLLSSIIGLLVPDSDDYYIPLCIGMKKSQKDITIGKKLEVTGTNDFEYFIAKHQYEKWKKTYGFAKNVIIIFSVLFNVLLLFLYNQTGYHITIGVCFGIVLLLSIFGITKLVVRNKNRKKYGIKDIEF